MGQAKRRQQQPDTPADGAAPAPGTPGAEPTPPGGWRKPRGLSARGWALLGAVVLALQFPLLHYALLRSAPEAGVRVPYEQGFDDPAVVARDFFTTGMYWRAQGGELLGPGPRNNPLWLKAALPPDVAVEFDVRAEDPGGDVRLELFGDGTDTASGYVLVHGLSANLSVLARRDVQAPPLSTLEVRARRKAERERLARTDPVSAGLWGPHTRVRVEATRLALQPGRTYHWRVERVGGVLRWFIDDTLMAELDDPFPLRGEGHDRLGLSGSEATLFFDNLQVRPLDALGPLPSRPAPPPGPPAGPYADDFERASLGEAWRATAPGAVRLEAGALVVEGALNRPVWLQHPLPEEAVIEFEAWTESPQGDIKVEAWGDGRSFHAGDPRAAYTASGYVFVLGGWRNSASTLARQSEHLPTNPVRQGAAVQPGKRHHFRIERRAGRIAWSVDGQPFLSLDDPQPLAGPLQRYFAFSGYQTRVHFDNLRIEPL